MTRENVLIVIQEITLRDGPIGEFSVSILIFMKIEYSERRKLSLS